MLRRAMLHVTSGAFPKRVFTSAVYVTKPNLPTVLHVAMSVGPTGRGSGRRLGRSGKVGLSP